MLRTLPQQPVESPQPDLDPGSWAADPVHLTAFLWSPFLPVSVCFVFELSAHSHYTS